MTLLNHNVPWPPPYTLRKHQRARRVIFKASRQHGLEVTVPVRFNMRELPVILETHKNWIMQQLLQCLRPLDVTPPSVIVLAACEQNWRVQYYRLQSRLRFLERPDGELALLGDTDDSVACKRLLKRWVRAKAQQFLHARTAAISERTGLRYSKLTIRAQKSRWGSCGSDGAINLNYKLIFLPAHLTDHIIIHELSHTVHMNHSKRFWAMVGRHDPRYREHRQAMRGADSYIPDWLQD